MRCVGHYAHHRYLAHVAELLKQEHACRVEFALFSQSFVVFPPVEQASVFLFLLVGKLMVEGYRVLELVVVGVPFVVIA